MVEFIGAYDEWLQEQVKLATALYAHDEDDMGWCAYEEGNNMGMYMVIYPKSHTIVVLREDVEPRLLDDVFWVDVDDDNRTVISITDEEVMWHQIAEEELFKIAVSWETPGAYRIHPNGVDIALITISGDVVSEGWLPIKGHFYVIQWLRF